MRDYEHMILAIDEVISHDVASIICMENYKNCYFPKGFRKVFDLFCEFRKDYETNKEVYQNEESQNIVFTKYQAKCRYKKEILFKNFIDELKAIEPDVEYEFAVKQYMEHLEKQDVQTQEMYLSIYPLLISLIRENEEKV